MIVKSFLIYTVLLLVNFELARFFTKPKPTNQQTEKTFFIPKAQEGSFITNSDEYRESQCQSWFL
jgi:hypothetical protein